MEKYYIYEIKGIKVGCTNNLTKRQQTQLDKGKMVLLETHTSIDKASDRERELQLEKGYPVDKYTYKYWMENIHPLGIAACLTKEAIEKKSKSMTGVKKSKEHIEAIKKGQLALEAPYRRGIPNLKNRRKVRAFKDGKEYIFDSCTKAAKYIKGTQVGISHVLMGLQSRHRGYTFEYV
jgi:hypothetical protein